MQKEKGLESAPLKFRLVHDTDKLDSEKIKKMPPAPSSFPATSSFPSSFPSATFSSFPGSAPVPEPSGEGGAVDKDFESIVMMRSVDKIFCHKLSLKLKSGKVFHCF